MIKSSLLSSYDVIRIPVVTEKTTYLKLQGKYVFDVHKEASKPDIKRSIEEIFSVKVQSVNTLIRKGKNKVFRGRLGRRSDVKKAIVTLVPGASIDIEGLGN